jgi:CRP-like cAMP-binding protein/uncharacterized protein (DUF697 family)
MTARTYRKGDVLFRKGDAASEMFLTVTGKFLVTEIGIEIPAGRILGELGFVSPSNDRTQSVECIEDGEVLTVGYDRLREIYLDNPEFGYYFLRLTSDRLLQNFARLQGLVEESNTALAAAQAAKTANLPGSDQAGRAGGGPTKPATAAVLAINKVRAVAARRRKESATAPTTGFADNVIAMVPKWRARLAEILRTSTSAAESAKVEASLRRRRATAIVERHANYSAIGGFIPLPIANVAAITAVIMRMVRELNKLYDEPIGHERAYAIAIGLMGGIIPSGFAKLATSTIAPFVPGYNLVGLAVSSVAASTYARSVGRVLIDHLESAAALERDRLTLKVMRRWRNIWRIRLVRRDGAWQRTWSGR